MFQVLYRWGNGKRKLLSNTKYNVGKHAHTLAPTHALTVRAENRRCVLKTGVMEFKIDKAITCVSLSMETSHPAKKHNTSTQTFDFW